MRVAYTATALDDLNSIADYLKSRSPSGGSNVEADIRAAVGNLSAFPNSGRRQDEDGVRKAVSPTYRYRILYAVDADAEVVTILSILHPAQR